MSKNKHKKQEKKNLNSKLEIAEEMNLEPRLRPAKTGSVAQNTAKPIKSRKKHKDNK